MKTVSIQRVKARHPEWFSEGAMSFFNSTIHTDAFRAGVALLFVSSERSNYLSPAQFSIRQEKDGRITTIGAGFQGYKSLEEAMDAVKTIAHSAGA